MAMRAMKDRDTNVHDLAQRLGITTTTLYMYVNGDGTVKEPGQKLFDALKAGGLPWLSQYGGGVGFVALWSGSVVVGRPLNVSTVERNSAPSRMEKPTDLKFREEIPQMP